MKHNRSVYWPVGVALALTLGAAPLAAVAEPLPGAEPTPAVSPAPSSPDYTEPMESQEAIPEGRGHEEVIPPTSGGSPTAPSSPVPLVPFETTDPDPAPSDWLAELIGPLGARMGQGVERLEESGNAQLPTEKELDQIATAEQLAENGTLPEVTLPLTTSDPVVSSMPSTLSPSASFSFLTRATTRELQPAAQLAADWRPAGIQGIDVSSHQFNVDWRNAWNQGARFAYVKATEATSYINPYYPQQYNGSVNVGMYRGAYHFAIPSVSSGAQQANYFVDNGGGWSPDGRTLPPLLDIEYNPYPSLGNTCYNMSASAMVSWIRDFSNTVKARTGRVPMIYSTTDWWNRCTGSSTAFSDHPLHIANYNQVGAGALPAGWRTWNVWQYSSSGPFVGDSNVFNGSASELYEFTRRADTFYVDTRGAIGAAWLRSGGVDGAWGMPTSNEACYASYCAQTFDRSTAYWFASTGAVRTVYTAGAIGNAWSGSGRLQGQNSWGLPLSSETCYANVYCDQQFERASVYYWPSQGVRFVNPGSYIGKGWTASGTLYGKGSWGIPITNETCYPTYCTQSFERAITYSTADGVVRTVNPSGAIGQAWASAGTLFGAGSWGLPLTDEDCVSGNCTQAFERNTALWKAETGVGNVRTVSPIGEAWTKDRQNGQPWGLPVADQHCFPTYCTQTFTDRVSYSTASAGVTSVLRLQPIGKAWESAGGIIGAGSWGIPLSSHVCHSTYCTQVFERVTAYSTENAVQVVRSNTPIGHGWQSSGGIIGSASWGLPQNTETCYATYCTQAFERTVAYWTAESGVNKVLLTHALGRAWADSGKIHGKWGMPTGQQTCYDSYCTQKFERVVAYWTPGDGVSSVYLPSEIGRAWSASGGIHGLWGMSVRDQTCSGTSACAQEFERLRATWTAAEGVRVTPRQR